MVNNFQVIPNVLSDDDISTLIQYWNSIDVISKINNNNWDIKNKVITEIDVKFRKVRITGIQYNQFPIITEKIKTTCEAHLECECELEFPHYLTEYDIGAFHKRHIDNSFGYTKRDKVIGIQLSDSDNYLGGDLIINNEKVPRTKGSLIIYDGATSHEVTKVIDGIRYSLTECLTLKKPKSGLI